MSFRLEPATEADAERIAEVHLAAFDANPLLHVQFPTASSRKALQTILRDEAFKTIHQGEVSGRVVFVVRDTTSTDNAIISFAKWDLPELDENAEAHPGAAWPTDCNVEYLDKYHELAHAMKKRVMGVRRCYRMTFVGTDPKHQGKGAATILTRWGLEQAEKSGVPVYLESTNDAISLYERLGFVSRDELVLPLPGPLVDGCQRVYREGGMLWESLRIEIEK